MRRFYHVFTAMLVLMLALSVPAFADPDEGGQQTETEAEKEDLSVVLKTQGSKAFLHYKATGKKVTGLTGIQELPEGSGNYYYFINKYGRVYKKTWIKNGGKSYYAKNNGKLASGFTKIRKKYYYFAPKTHALVKGLKLIKGKRYFFNAEGVRQTGFKTVKKHTYYFDPENNGAASAGWKKIGKKWYYFARLGRMQKGIITVDGKKYFLNANGVRKSGIITVNGKKYFFDPKAKGAMKTGWVTYKKKTYYMNNKGEAINGWLNLSGKKYFFNASGVMQKGWVTMISGSEQRKYYFDTTTGAMFTNKHTIDGKTYDFGSKGYIVVEISGPYSIKVNQGTCVVTIYRGNTPVKAFLCSVGRGGATPNGTFSLGMKRHWHQLFGGVWGQYTSVITGNILFHSVYYYRYRDINSLSTTEYNKLGSPASAGCVRLNCAGAYYIYSNCPVGTKVTIFTGTSNDDPLGKPTPLRISGSSDPTDPNPND